MKNRRLLKLLIALLVVVVVVILSSTVFTLKNIELCFYTPENILIEDYEAGLTHFTEGDTQDIIESGDFALGKNIFFVKKQPSIDKIEAKYPYIKVIGISATFPDGFRIKARERVAMYRIPLSNGKHAICDSELKVLEIKDSADQYNYIYLKGMGIDSLTPGQFVSEEATNAILKKLGNEFLSNRYDTVSSIKNFEYVTIDTTYLTASPTSKSTNLIIQTRSFESDGHTRIAGVRLVIENIYSNFENKLNKALSIYSNYCKNGDVKSQSGTIKVFDDISAVYDSTSTISEDPEI